MKGTLPYISVVVAARNEATNIKSCVESLMNQDYPSHLYDVWIGDDQSEDNTKEIVEELTLKKRNLHLIEISEQWKHLKGKANVLAQVIHQTKGEYILLTDADVFVNPAWISTMVKGLGNETSMVTGATVVGGKSLVAQLQRSEWIFYVGNGHLQSEKGSAVSAIGNNMGFSRLAYNHVGGYEGIPFSITEDLELFKQVTAKGKTFKSLFEPGALAFTSPIGSLNTLFHQRKRWISGVFQLPLYLKLGLFFIWSLLLFFILIGMLLGFKIMIITFVIKWKADIVFLGVLYKKLNLNIDLGTILYTPYSLIFNMLFLCFYFFPVKVVWKGRKY